MKLLRVFASGRQSWDATLWWANREDEAPLSRGLGGEVTSNYGYMFCGPNLIDFSTMTFFRDITESMRIFPEYMAGWYRKANQMTFDANNRIDFCQEILQRFDHNKVREEIIVLMVDVCIRQYRIDTLVTMDKELTEEAAVTYLADTIKFSWDGLIAAYGKIALIGGEKGIQNKMKARTPEEMFE